MNILFVIPIFNDWASFRQLARGIETALASYECGASILAIDDGSSVEIDRQAWASETFERIKQIEIAQLACNLGHQKAIAIGLSLASRREGVDAIVVMDGDGEDSPADLPLLLDALRDGTAPIVLAHRAKRSEGTAFRVFYFVYKALFRRLTGVSLSFGNYCALTAAAAKRLTFMPNLWNSLPATCLRSKLPIHTVPTIRGSRYEGEPKMNFVGLILHGMQAITVFSDTVLVRLSLAAVAVAGVAALVVVTARLISFDWVVPGWASNMMGFLALSLLTVLFGLLSTSLLTLQERCNMPMIPHLHADMYVQRIHRLLG
jgi:polyisoprenyl-phosphate glycosyltransferase